MQNLLNYRYNIGILPPIYLFLHLNLTTKQSKLPAQFSRHIYLAVRQRRHSNNNSRYQFIASHIGQRANCCSPLYHMLALGLIVQSWVRTNPKIKIKHAVLVCVNVFRTSVFSKLQKSKLLSIQTRFLKKHFQIYKQAVWKFALNFRLT